MKKFSVLLLFALMNLSDLFGNYFFEGITYLNSIDLLYRFQNGNFEILEYTENEEWKITAYPCEIKEEGAYLVAYFQKNNNREKYYVFSADKNHIILYDTKTKDIIIGTEKKGHRDEPWIYSTVDTTASSYLVENLGGKEIKYLPENLTIYKLPFSWVEGVEGFGKNESVSFKNCGNGSRRIYIINGFFSPEKPSLYYDNNRVKKILINCYKNNEIIKTETRVLEDSGKMQFLEFADRYDSFDFIIEEVYPGRKYNDTAITGIFIDALDCYE